MGARMYMPKLGRFLAPDPLWEAFPSLTPYHFAYNNPISFHDKSGLAPEKEKGDRMISPNLDINNLMESKYSEFAAEAFYSILELERLDFMTDFGLAKVNYL